MTFPSLMHRSPSSPGLGFAGLNTELMILIAALAVVSVVLLIAAAYLRRSPLRRHHRRHRHHRHSRKPSDQGTETANPAAPKKWRRRRRRDHRPRNPTLAETGGLPPIRSENAPERPA